MLAQENRNQGFHKVSWHFRYQKVIMFAVGRGIPGISHIV